jgi:polyphosphate kinase 2 (PPK2 family)
MGLCSTLDYQQFMRRTPDFQRMLVRSGDRAGEVRVLGLARRAASALRGAATPDPPVRRRKPSPSILAFLDTWEASTEAKEAMIFYTDTADAPWTDKKRTRLEAMR